MKFTNEAKILKHAIEITDKDTGKKQFLCMDNNKWIKISEEEYNKFLGDKDGKQ